MIGPCPRHGPRHGRLVRHAAEQLGVIELGRRCLGSGQLPRHVAFQRPVDMAPAHLQLCLKRRQLKPGVLEIEHCLAESLAILGERHGLVKRPLRRGLRQLAIGFGAAAVTYVLGLLFGVSAG